VEALFVWNRAEGVVRVDALVADTELRELMVRTKAIDGLL
jgi:hypothetical protein